MNAAKFSDLWAQLTRPTTGEFTMGFVGDTPIRLAVDGDGFHHVLIPADDFAGTTYQGGDALRARIRDVGIQKFRYDRYLDVYCVNSTLTHSFDRLAAELIEIAASSSKPVDDALKCLAEWKHLFTGRKRRSLTPQERIGIFAELGVLKDFVDAGQIIETSCWTGPSKAPHDFEFETMSLEVKAYGRGSEQVTFHGPLQLDSLEGKPLFLCLRQVEEDENGLSLLELADEIEDNVDDPQVFRTTLNKIGVIEDDESLQHFKYSVIRESLFEVTDETPRIVASSFIDGEVPPGIDRLRYSIEPEDLITGVAYSNVGSWLSEVGK